ncbi:unnamed protein product, partial [Coregonus sp. 'balchen']
MAAVRSLLVSIKPDSGPDRSESDSDSDSDRDARESEPMEVEEGELKVEDIPVNRSLKELLPDTSRRYENKAGTFITGIDVTSKALHVAGVDDMSTQDVFGYFKDYPPAHIEWIDDTSCNVVWLDDVTSTRALINISRMPDPEVVTTETDHTKEPGDPTQESKARGERGSDDDDDEEGEVDEEEKEMVKENEGKASEGETEKKTEPETTQ